MISLPLFTFINGPPSSGKDTLAHLLCEAVPSSYIESFAEPIRAMIYNVFFPNEGPITYNFDLREGPVKARSMPFQLLCEDEGCLQHGTPHVCNPYSIRDEMIAFSEEYLKRRYGQQIFGKLLWARAEEQMMFSNHFIIPDNGFVPEAQFIIDEVGPHRCLLIRLNRAGTSFANDSRSYIDLPGVRTLDLHNNAPPSAMIDALQLILGTL